MTDKVTGFICVPSVAFFGLWFCRRDSGCCCCRLPSELFRNHKVPAENQDLHRLAYSRQFLVAAVAPLLCSCSVCGKSALSKLVPPPRRPARLGSDNQRLSTALPLELLSNLLLPRTRCHNDDRKISRSENCIIHV